MRSKYPTVTFRIPSIHDGKKLDCRISLPDELKQIEHVSTWSDRGAIIAHPYAPLGGSYNDPVVNFVAEELRLGGCVVGTFNFR